MKKFWVQWQLWEKMCFCLATAIAVVIMLGCVKLMYDRWQLRKYTKLAEEKKARFSQMYQRQMEAGHYRPPIPFGVRAIESGVEVDGVWISRQTSPGSKIGSLNSSYQSKRSGETSPSELAGTGASTPLRHAAGPTDTRAYKPAQSHQTGSTAESSPTKTSANTEALDGRRSSSKPRRDTSRLVHHKKSLDRLMGAEVQTHTEANERRRSERRYTSSGRSKANSVNTPSQSSSSSAKSFDAVSYTPTTISQTTNPSSKPSSQKNFSRPASIPSPPPQVRYPRTSSDREVVAVVPRGAIDARPFLEGGASNLDWLMANRMNHAAETGQLGQRGSVMPPPPALASQRNDDFTGLHNNSTTSMTSSGLALSTSGTVFPASDYFSRPVTDRRHTSEFSATSGSSPLPYYPFDTTTGISDPKIVRASMPPTPVASYLPSTYSPLLSDSVAEIEEGRREDTPIEQTSGSYRPSQNLSELSNALQHGTSNAEAQSSKIAESHGFEPTQRLHFNRAVRKVNSGFEILPAGTFSGQPGDEGADGEGAVETQGEKHKKLRKRSRSRRGSDSRKSRVSGIFEERGELT